MSISAIADKRIKHVSFDVEYLTVDLMDGRRVSTPMAWYPRLAVATEQQLAGWEICGDGSGVHWDALDEDLCVEGMLRGIPAAGYQSRS